MEAQQDLKSIIIQQARVAGFDLARITSAEEFTQDQAIALERLQQGLMDGWPWYTEERIRRGTRPQELLPGARSIICLGLNYYQSDDANQPESAPTGKVARYARGRDYHRVMKQRMKSLAQTLSASIKSEIRARWYVDDGPMLDRAAAQRAGLGWFGKNTNILTPDLGSWLLLGQIITDLPLEPDMPLQKTCGNCARCIDACPTGAIVAPYVIDNVRCISYQTIENRGPIPRELRPLMQDWVFGCDICQEVCPVNRKARPTNEPAFQRKELATVELIELLEMSENEFRSKFQGTPVMRAKWAGMQRNSCVALGNRKDPASIPALRQALTQAAPLVRAHAAWALGQMRVEAAAAALRQAQLYETDRDVQEEIDHALSIGQNNP